jgi:hypothetical protein
VTDTVPSTTPVSPSTLSHDIKLSGSGGASPAPGGATVSNPIFRKFIPAQGHAYDVLPQVRFDEPELVRGRERLGEVAQQPGGAAASASGFTASGIGAGATAAGDSGTLSPATPERTVVNPIFRRFIPSSGAGYDVLPALRSSLGRVTSTHSVDSLASSMGAGADDGGARQRVSKRERRRSSQHHRSRRHKEKSRPRDHTKHRHRHHHQRPADEQHPPTATRSGSALLSLRRSHSWNEKTSSLIQVVATQRTSSSPRDFRRVAAQHAAATASASTPSACAASTATPPPGDGTAVSSSPRRHARNSRPRSTTVTKVVAPARRPRRHSIGDSKHIDQTHK